MTTTETWLDLGPLDDLPEGRPVLRKAGGLRFACVRAGDHAFAIDDRCPHQGYPLSQGSCKDGVLTCEWHNWKFDLATGECTFGGEAVRRYPTRVEGGRVHLSTAIDAEREAARLRIGLAKALARDEMGRALREALRLGQITEHPRAATLGTIAAGLELCAQDGARRAEYGFDHGLAVLADLTTWTERGWLGHEEAFVAAAHAVAEPSRHLGARPVAPPEAAGVEPLDPARLCDALIHERREEAEARVRAITRAHGGARAAAALVPFLARHLYDYGHGAIFVAKAAELADRFPAIAEDVLGSVVVTLAWATAETSLPPFTATRAAVARLDALPAAGEGLLAKRSDFSGSAAVGLALDGSTLGASAVGPALDGSALGASAVGLALDGSPLGASAGGLALDGSALGASAGGLALDGSARAEYERAVLSGEAAAANATVDLLAHGFDPRAILRAVAHAAAERIRRFDVAWEGRTDAEVGVLDVTHTFTFAESAIALAMHAEPRDVARLAVLAAAFVGKVRAGDREDLSDPAPRTSAPDLASAVEARDAGRAIAIARAMSADERRAAYASLAPFAALDAATRPIFYAHTVKNTEAFHRLDRADPHSDATYLVALLSYIVPPRRELRLRRVAAVAHKFLADGRPPEGLY